MLEESGGADLPGLHVVVLPVDGGGDDYLVPSGAKRPDILNRHSEGAGVSFLLFLSRMDGDDFTIGTGTKMLVRVAGVGVAAAEEMNVKGLCTGSGHQDDRYGHARRTG